MRGLFRASAIALATCGIISLTTTAPGRADTSDLGRIEAPAPPTTPAIGTLSIPNTDITVRTWEALHADGSFGPLYAVSLDGREWTTVRETSYDLLLRYAHFDPLDAIPGVPDALRTRVDVDAHAADEEHVYIVQFITQPLEAYRQAIRAIGGDVRQFIANHAHLVRMTEAERARVAALPYVRWIGFYEPAYRVEEFVLDHFDDAHAVYPLQHYNIMLFDSALPIKDDVADRIAALGGQVHSRDAGKHLIEATLTPEQLYSVAGWNEVLFIDRWSPIETDMDVARTIGGADFLETTAGYTGAGVRGEVIDVGFNTAHVDFAASPLIEHTTIDSDSHGAATSGIVFGDGTGDPMGRGLAPDGQGIIADASYVTNRYTHTGELVQSPYFAVFQSASIGSTRTMHYTTLSADADAALFDFDILHCQSQSNAFNQDSRPRAWAKNIVSVGGIRHFNTLSQSDDCWGCGASGASIGPAEDGRIKPDLAHFYDNIFTTTTGSDTAYTSSFGGTSGATPIVAGHFALFYQMWDDGIFGNVVDPLGTVFDNRPHMTAAKAMLINTASQYNFNGAGHDLTRTHQGWGMPNLQDMYNLRNKMLIVDESDVITPLETKYYNVTVAPGEAQARFTLTWADPPGVPGSSQARINDLSLRITAPNGDIFWGNAGLRQNNFSQTGGNRDTINTVENVLIQNPVAGQWLIEVIADEINEDAHVETGALDADFALVVSGISTSMPALTIALPDGVPALIAQNVSTDIPVRIIDGGETYVPGTGMLHYRFDSGDAFSTVALAAQGGNDYLATLPAAPCGAAPEFYFSAQGDGATTVFSPDLGVASPFAAAIGSLLVIFEDDFETDLGWTVENDPALTFGAWERGVPVGLGERGDPPTDYDGSGSCFLTENAFGNSDVDGGYTRLISPSFSLVSDDARISYALWYDNSFGAAPNDDFFRVEISNDDGATWTLAQLFGPASAPGWSEQSFLVSSTGIAPTSTMRLRFEASDADPGSVVEAGVDALRIDRVVCVGPCPSDLNADTVVNVLDLLDLLTAWGVCAGCPQDLNGDGAVNVVDLLQMLTDWGPC